MLARNGGRPATECTVNRARKASGVGNAETSKPNTNKSQAAAIRAGLTGPNTPPAGKSTVTTVSGRLLAEGNDDYRPIVAVLNGRWRVVECAGGIQWILQCYGGPDRWRSRFFCRTREGLIACAREYAGPIGGDALVVLLRLPRWIGGES